MLFKKTIDNIIIMDTFSWLFHTGKILWWCNILTKKIFYEATKNKSPSTHTHTLLDAKSMITSAMVGFNDEAKVERHQGEVRGFN